MEKIRVQSGGTLVAMMPFILGFRPEKSIVFVTLSGDMLIATIRIDLDLLGQDGLIEQVAETLRSVPEATRVAVLFFAERTSQQDENLRQQFLESLGDRLAQRGVPVVAAISATSSEPGARWHCVCGCDQRGVVPDMAGTEAAAVISTAEVAASRNERIAVVQPDAKELLDKREALRRRLGLVTSSAQESWTRINRIIADRASGTAALTDKAIVQMSLDLQNLTVRDACVSFAFDGRARVAEELFTELTRSSPRPWLVEPAFLVSAFAWMRGDGVVAGAALDRLFQVTGAHSGGQLMATVLQFAVPPHKVKTALQEAARDALKDLEHGRG